MEPAGDANDAENVADGGAANNAEGDKATADEEANNNVGDGGADVNENAAADANANANANTNNPDEGGEQPTTPLTMRMTSHMNRLGRMSGKWIPKSTCTHEQMIYSSACMGTPRISIQVSIYRGE